MASYPDNCIYRSVQVYIIKAEDDESHDAFGDKISQGDPSTGLVEVKTKVEEDMPVSFRGNSEAGIDKARWKDEKHRQNAHSEHISNSPNLLDASFGS